MTEQQITTLVEEIFNKLRTHPKLGKGSCSSVDEAMTDEELKTAIREDVTGEYWYNSGEKTEPTYVTVEGAIEWWMDMEKIFWEKCDINWETGKYFDEEVKE